MKFFCVLSLLLCAATIDPAAAEPAIQRSDVQAAEKIIGLEFTDAKRDLLLPGLNEQLTNYLRLREVTLSNSVPPALLFNPIPIGYTWEKEQRRIRWVTPKGVKLPADTNELAFYSVAELGALLRAKKLTSEQLTRFCLERLKSHGPKLECVVTLTEELALTQARRADAELAAGNDRGPLHGIPYGAKDLLATKGIPTTWGSVPYQRQVFAEDATVIRRLEAAGAVLVAKLTLGELAWGDVWFGGKTRNPWNTEHGSSGSSAGSASAVSAGLVPFAIGSETWGSIVSPSTVCGTTGLRPTYGRVSRTGAMALAWSMDKVGPIARNVEDCAMVFAAIHGLDPQDQTLYEAAFNYDPKAKLKGLRVGYLKADFDKANQPNDQKTLDTLRQLGVELIPIELPKLPVSDLSFILSAEAATAFDELTRSGRDDLLVRQVQQAWPNAFREARFIPAVEYLQANRVRHLLIQEMARVMSQVDVYVAPAFGGDNLLLTNLSGHPCVVLPNGFKEGGLPTSITFVGQLFAKRICSPSPATTRAPPTSTANIRPDFSADLVLYTFRVAGASPTSRLSSQEGQR